MKTSSLLTLIILSVSPFVLGACSLTGIATGAGATAGVAAAQDGGIRGAVNDTKIQVAINDLWFRHDVDMFTKLDMTVNQGRVLLTGVVQNPEHRVEAVRLAWQPAGVKQVINEIRVAESDGLMGFARDTWITGRLRTALTFDRQVLSINYNIDTVQGSVYLMGVAQNQAELNRVIEVARTIPDVKQVVSYVKMAGQVSESGANNNFNEQPAAPAVDDYYAPDDYSSAPPAAENSDMEYYPVDTPQTSGAPSDGSYSDYYSSGAYGAQPLDQNSAYGQGQGNLGASDYGTPSPEQLLNNY